MGKSQAGQSVVQVTPRVSLQANPGTKVYATTQGSKFTLHMTANTETSHLQPPLKKPATAGRGFPPPVPPNKPAVPPKKDAVRRIEAENKVSEQIGVGVGIKYNVNIRDKVHCPEVHEDEAARREPQVRDVTDVAAQFFSASKFLFRNQLLFFVLGNLFLEERICYHLRAELIINQFSCIDNAISGREMSCYRRNIHNI